MIFYIVYFTMAPYLLNSEFPVLFARPADSHGSSRGSPEGPVPSGGWQPGWRRRTCHGFSQAILLHVTARGKSVDRRRLPLSVTGGERPGLKLRLPGLSLGARLAAGLGFGETAGAGPRLRANKFNNQHFQ